MLSVIGIGPGSQAMMTMEAVEALQAAEIVVGYKTYTHLVKAFTGDKQVIKTGMCKEIERCQAAIELAQAGHNVALISSGDAGIFCVDGEMFCKQYYRDPLGMVYLFSLNRKRADADILLPPESGRSLVCLGRVMLHTMPLTQSARPEISMPRPLLSHASVTA